jgi:hypothetical protein
MLMSEQKETFVGTSGDLINMTDKDNELLNNRLTQDETWCFLFDPQTKQQSSE